MDFIDEYIRYTSHQVSPEAYHRWTALTILGATMERRCWLVRGYDALRIYPGQLMVVLVGRSALAKKSTAINMGVSLLAGLEPWQVQVMPKATSPSELLNSLQRMDEESGLPLSYPDDAPAWSKTIEGVPRRLNSTGLVVASELATFFSNDSWNEAMATKVSDFNDAPSGRQELRYRSYRVNLWNPLIGLIGGITPKGIAAELPKAARSAGFFGRILWVHSHGTDRWNPLTEMVPEEREAKTSLQDSLRQIAMMYGPFKYTKQGKAWFEDWSWNEYRPQLQRMDQLGILDTSGYWGRKDAHLLRVAMACSASRSLGQDRCLYEADLRRASGYLTELERGFAAAMSEIGVGAAQTEENARILGFIERREDKYKLEHRWVPAREISKYANTLGMKKYHLDDCLSRLRSAGEIEAKWRRGEHWWRRQWSQASLMRRALEEGEGAAKVPKVVPIRREERINERDAD